MKTPRKLELVIEFPPGGIYSLIAYVVMYGWKTTIIAFSVISTFITLWKYLV